MSEKPFFEEMMANNPYLSMSEDNPFVILEMMKACPVTSGENPFSLMAQNMEFANLFVVWQQMMVQMWDMWMVGLGGLSWTQNEFENALRKQLSELAAVREDLTTLGQEMSKQAAKNQAAIIHALEEAIINEKD